MPRLTTSQYTKRWKRRTLECLNWLKGKTVAYFDTDAHDTDVTLSVMEDTKYRVTFRCTHKQRDWSKGYGNSFCDKYLGGSLTPWGLYWDEMCGTKIIDAVVCTHARVALWLDTGDPDRNTVEVTVPNGSSVFPVKVKRKLYDPSETLAKIREIYTGNYRDNIIPVNKIKWICTRLRNTDPAAIRMILDYIYEHRKGLEHHPYLGDVFGKREDYL